MAGLSYIGNHCRKSYQNHTATYTTHKPHRHTPHASQEINMCIYFRTQAHMQAHAHTPQKPTCINPHKSSFTYQVLYNKSTCQAIRTSYTNQFTHAGNHSLQALDEVEGAGKALRDVDLLRTKARPQKGMVSKEF